MSRGLRIGLVCPYSFDHHGGVQNHVLGLAQQLTANGHRVCVLAPGTPAVAPTGVEIAHAGAAFPVPYNGSIARVNFGPVTAARVTRWLRRGDFDLVHLHEPITPSISLLALAAADVPVVATFHTATPRSRTMTAAGRTLAGLIRKIDAGVAVSESARRVVIQHLGRDAVVVPNGFDPEPFTTAARRADMLGTRRGQPWRGGAVPRITFLGRTDEPRKGLQVLLDALPALRAVRPDVEVVVAGAGRLPQGVLGGVLGGVRELGAVTDTAKEQLLARTDVFVAPHLARESFGIVLLEALAAGASVVASALPAFVDLLDQVSPNTAQIVPVGDPGALAAGILRALALPMQEEPTTDLAPFTWPVVGPQLEIVYRAALTAGPQTTGTAGGRVRAIRRVEQTWTELDAALVRRAASAADGGSDASPGVVGSAAGALRTGLGSAERERAESDLSEALRRAGMAAGPEHQQARLARRVHNDAVAAARRAGRSADLRSFEMVEC